MAELKPPAWFVYMQEGPEKRAVRRYISAGGSYDSWAYMAPELKQEYFEEDQ